MPDAEHRNIFVFGENCVAHDIGGGAVPNNELAYTGSASRRAQMWEFVECLNRGPDRGRRLIRIPPDRIAARNDPGPSP